MLMLRWPSNKLLLSRMLHPLPAKKKFQFLRQRMLLERKILERIPNKKLSISLRNLPSTMKLMVQRIWMLTMTCQWMICWTLATREKCSRFFKQMFLVVGRGLTKETTSRHSLLLVALARINCPEHQFPFVSGHKIKQFSTPKCCWIRIRFSRVHIWICPHSIRWRIFKTFLKSSMSVKPIVCFPSRMDTTQSWSNNSTRHCMSLGIQGSMIPGNSTTWFKAKFSIWQSTSYWR